MAIANFNVDYGYDCVVRGVYLVRLPREPHKMKALVNASYFFVLSRILEIKRFTIAEVHSSEK